MSAPAIARGIFVTGTDTGVGKTRVATALLRAFVAAGGRAVGMKPVAAGVDPAAALNADVAALVAAGNVQAPLADVNPFAFAPAIAPHVAATAAGRAIDLDRIAAAYASLARRADLVVVEGAGGALVPLDEQRDMLDIASRLGLPVLLVVGMRLGMPQPRAAVRGGDPRARPGTRRMGRQPDRSGDGGRRREPGDAGSPTCGAALGRPGLAVSRRRVAAATDASGRVASDARRHARKLSRRAGFSANAEKPG